MSYCEKAKKERAFGCIFHLYYAPLVSFAKKLIKDQFSAEGIVTEIFVKFWHKEEDFENTKAAKAYLYKSTRNACINYNKEKRRNERLRMSFESAFVDTEDFILNEMIRAEVLREADRVLESLPTECRRIMRLALVHGHDNMQIAEKLNISVFTVRNQKSRGMMLMQKKFSDMQYG